MIELLLLLLVILINWRLGLGLLAVLAVLE